MSIELKTREQIAIMREAGRIVAEVYEVLRPHVVPGVTTLDLDRMAEEYIRKRGAIPVYKGYVPAGGHGLPPFPGTICASVNDVICHGIPSQKVHLKEGDIIGVDIGVKFQGWCGDSCIHVWRGAGRSRLAALDGCDEAQPGIGDCRGAAPAINWATSATRFSGTWKPTAFSVVREYTGHGLGRDLHEAPTVLHHGQHGKGLKIRSGMVFTIEPMVNVGRPETKLMADRWGVRTADGSRSAQFEHSLAIMDNGPEILTLL